MLRLRDNTGRPLRIAAACRDRNGEVLGRHRIRLDDQVRAIHVQVGDDVDIWLDATAACRLGFVLLTWSANSDPVLAASIYRALPTPPRPGRSAPPAAAGGSAAAGTPRRRRR